MVRVDVGRNRYANRRGTSHRHPSPLARGRDAVAGRGSSEADAWLVLLILCGLLVVVGLVIALVLLVLFVAAVALAVWGTIALIRWLRQRRRSAVSGSVPSSPLVEADDLGLITHVQVLATFPNELRAAFDRPPAQHPAPTRRPTTDPHDGRNLT